MVPTELCGTSVGKKVVMAVTGLIVYGFVVGHLAGNLLIFLGPDALNAYAEKLRDLEMLLWAVRFVLIGAVGLHIWFSVVLAIENKKARPIGYEVKKTIQTSYAARTMMISGALLLAFIVYHLLHFTFRVTHPDLSHLADASGRHDVYSMVVLSFQNPYLVLAYCVSMVFLCLHLSHGGASLFQSLGLNNEALAPKLTRLARTAAIMILVGYVSIPVCVLSGVIQAP